jgi:hypothetical protein
MGIRRQRRKRRLEPDFNDLIRREEAMKTLQQWGDEEFGKSEPSTNVRILSDAEWAEYQTRWLSDVTTDDPCRSSRRRAF